MLKMTNSNDKFTEIYTKNLWRSKDSVSGNGSTKRSTKNLRLKLPELLIKYSIKSVLDAPCGDFVWMEEVLQKFPNIKYFGGDIVDELIKANKSKHSRDNVSFIQLDITKDKLPKADLMIVRDCLFHLSYLDISRFLANFKKSDIGYLLTTSHYGENITNKDIITGSFRLIDISKPPFNFKNPIECFDDFNPIYQKKKLSLYLKKDVPTDLS